MKCSLATEWQVDNLKVTQAARAIEGASQPGGIEFVRLPDDANIVVFSILVEKSTFCGNVRIQDSAVGMRQRLLIRVSDDGTKAPPKPGGIAGIFAKKAKFEANPAVIEKAITALKTTLPPI